MKDTGGKTKKKQKISLSPSELALCTRIATVTDRILACLLVLICMYDQLQRGIGIFQENNPYWSIKDTDRC